MSYHPIKSLTGKFFEGLSTSIQSPIVKIKSLTLVAGYNINFLNRKELDILDTILAPYGLHVLSKTEPKRTGGFQNHWLITNFRTYPISVFSKPTFHTLYWNPKPWRMLIIQYLLQLVNWNWKQLEYRLWKRLWTNQQTNKTASNNLFFLKETGLIFTLKSVRKECSLVSSEL